MSINYDDGSQRANHYTKPPPNLMMMVIIIIIIIKIIKIFIKIKKK